MAKSNILRRPIITEKSSGNTGESTFVFEVDKRASKGQVKQAVEKAFKVTVMRVNTLIVPGKLKRNRRLGKVTKSSSWKKAVVSLKSGDKIDLFETKEGKK